MKEQNVKIFKRLSCPFLFFHEEIALSSQMFSIHKKNNFSSIVYFPKLYSCLYIESMCSFWLQYKLFIMNFRGKKKKWSFSLKEPKYI